MFGRQRVQHLPVPERPGEWLVSTRASVKTLQALFRKPGANVKLLQMCEEGSSGPASCVITTETRTQCQCSAFPSYAADSYDPQNYLLCFSSTLQIPLSCPTGEEFDTATSKCAAVPTTAQPTVTCTEVSLPSESSEVHECAASLTIPTQSTQLSSC